MASMAKLPKHLNTKLISHAQKVCEFYKQCLQEMRSQHPKLLDYRYNSVLVRKRFDEHKDEIDMIKAKAVLQEGYKEFTHKRCPIPFRYTNCPGGIAYGREANTPDFVLDQWHPLEKQQYPDYFARRDQRKQEYIERWHQKYGSSPNAPSS